MVRHGGTKDCVLMLMGQAMWLLSWFPWFPMNVSFRTHAYMVQWFNDIQWWWSNNLIRCFHHGVVHSMPAWQQALHWPLVTLATRHLTGKSYEDMSWPRNMSTRSDMVPTRCKTLHPSGFYRSFCRFQVLPTYFLEAPAMLQGCILVVAALFMDRHISRVHPYAVSKHT